MVNPELLALVGILLLILLAPTSRLQRRGWVPRALGSYLTTMIVLGVLVAWAPSLARYLVPIFAVGYLLPFIGRPGRRRDPGGRGQSGGAATHSPGRPPMKVVHGPARDVPPAERDAPDSDGQPRTWST